MVPAAVGDDAAGPDGVDAVFFDQAAECVEGAAGFEGADFLLVFAFEEEADGGFGGVGGDGGVIFRGAVRRGFAGGIGSCGGTSLGLGGRCEVVECRASYHGGPVDVGLDAFVGGLNGLSGQWRAGGMVSHCGKKGSKGDKSGCVR